MPSYSPPIDKNLRLMGDKVLLEVCADQSLNTPGDNYESPDGLQKVGTLYLANDTYKGIIKGKIHFIGSEISEPEIRVGSYVLVPEFAGATPVKFGDKIFKLYNTKDCIAILRY